MLYFSQNDREEELVMLKTQSVGGMSVFAVESRQF